MTLRLRTEPLDDGDFERSIFINCPFDSDYEPILQAILFCVVFVGLEPRLALTSQDSGTVRIEKIVGMIVGSKYSIHDLSRCQARKEGEFARLNMPLELGIDYGCRRFYGQGRDAKRLLILEEKPYRYQAAISDLAGCDIQSHAGNFEQAVRRVRNWIASETAADVPSPSRILGAYEDFQEWYYETRRAAGFSERSILEYPTREFLSGMKRWMASGRPV